MEQILCAAIHYQDQPTAFYLPVNIKKGVIIAGHRHPHCLHTFIALTGKRSVTTECGAYTQGFLTNTNRFVDREEGALIAYEAGQTKENVKVLYSEHLY